MPFPRSPAEIFAAFMDAMKNETVKVRVATVTNVSLDRQTVDVQLCTNNPIFDEIGNVYTEPAPSISDVPYGILRGGGMMVSLPLEVGDAVLLLFSDLSTDVWRAGDGTAQDPGFVGKHTFDSAFAIPMFDRDARFFVDPEDSTAAGKLLIGKDGGAAQIRISTSAIELGNAVTDNVALSSKCDIEFNNIKLTLASLAGASFSVPYTPVAGGVKSTLVKAQ